MRKLLVALMAMTLMSGLSAGVGYGEAHVLRHGSELTDSAISDSTIQPYRRGGSFRSPRTGYNPGVGNPRRTTPDNATRNPPRTGTTPAPAPRTGFGGFFGGLFGGLALGTILGGLFNPFAGFSLGAPFLSLISIALWIAVIYFVVRLFRRRSRY
ncbi:MULTISPECIES: hypothetical protein [Cohnella]|uniref:hypothetical protein n=1 Tax=Cohnella TaxID=329857 RepID=UPI0009BA3A53|nr:MULTISPECIES: hypothetical protein [Cohnella]MBN2983714.1 hypothetical protein [Cohnella algarum]